MRPTDLRRNLLIAPLVALLLALPTLARAGDDYERWYTVELAGKRAGYMHSLQKTENGRITSASKMVMRMARADNSVAMVMEGQFVETTDGKPVSMRTVQQLGAAPKTVEYTFGEHEIAVATAEGGQRTASTRPLPDGSWLTPAASSEYIRQRLAAGADKIVVRTIDPMSGPKAETLTLSGIERTTVEARGKPVPAVKCTSSTSAQPGVSMTEYMDEQGIPIRSQVGLGLIKINVVVSDRETALANPGEIPEIMVKTFITPDRPVPHPRTTTTGVYILSIPEGPMPALPDTGVQRVSPVDGRSARVAIAPGATPAPEEDTRDPAYTASTSMLKSGDPRIKALVEEAIRGAGDDRVARAQAMRAFVQRYITTKNLDVGFASASEVARSRSGDCTEHGTLLAAMLRADGIPARVVSGLVYVEEEAGKGIFGYHMWTQALLQKAGKPAWVDLDGTLPGAAFDATHIALATSALAEGEEATSLSAILPLMGRLEIKVERAE